MMHDDWALCLLSKQGKSHMIMVALVAAATSGSTPISSISGPCGNGAPACA